MKCDFCKYQKYFNDDNQANCLKGHWFGLGESYPDDDQTLWDNCDDFETGKKSEAND